MKISNAANTASEKAAEARKDATTDKLDAQYAVAREKCETYSGDTKDRCLNEAKARFGT